VNSQVDRSCFYSPVARSVSAPSSRTSTTAADHVGDSQDDVIGLQDENRHAVAGKEQRCRQFDRNPPR
jgi:hypothetical protein